MNKLQLTAIASLLVASTGYAQASTLASACNGFEIQVQNKLLDDLVVTKIELNGAEIQPGGIQKINANTAETFTVNNSQDSAVMKGNFVFQTVSLPTRQINIQFDLKNGNLICEHDDFSQSEDYAIDKSRLSGQVKYTIANKQKG